MRSIFFLCCVALAGLCACESEPQEGQISCVEDIVIQIVLTDPELNDRLNPGSPSLLGEEYTQGIEVMYRYKDQKLTLPLLWPLQTHGGAILGEWSTIYPPYKDDEVYGMVNQNTMGYYYIEASPFVTEGNRDIAYTYIQYPDGNEDEIKVQLYRTSSLLLMDQIWINGELVYSMHPKEGSLSTKQYYNPEYYPFLVPTLDDDGKQIGDLVQPEGGTSIIVIRDRQNRPARKGFKQESPIDPSIRNKSTKKTPKNC